MVSATMPSASGSRDCGELFVWNVHSGERVHAIRHPGVVSALIWLPRGDLVVSGGSDGRLRWWDLQSDERYRTLRRDRPYERLNITGIQGLTRAQLASLRALGAVEDEALHSP